MTWQRYLYKLFWKKVGVPLVIGCAVIALVTTFYHHSKYGLINTHSSDNHGYSDRIVTNQHPHTTDRVSEANLDHNDLGQQSHRSLPGKGAKHKPSQAKHIQEEIELDDKELEEFHKPRSHAPGESVNTAASVLSISNMKSKSNLVRDTEQLSSTQKSSPLSKNVTFEKRGVLKIVNPNQSKTTNANHKNVSKLQPTVEIYDARSKTLPNIHRQNNSVAKDTKYHTNQNITNNSVENTADKLVEAIHVEHGISATKDFVLMDNENEHIDSTFEDDDPPPQDGIGKEDYEDSFLPDDLNPILTVPPQRHSTLYYNPLEPPEVFKQWRLTKNMQCDGKFVAYYGEFAYLKGVILNKSKFIGKSGGEDLHEVLNQPEKAEYFEYDLGCFQLKCDTRLQYYFNNGHHLPDYVFSVQSSDVDTKDYTMKIADFTIAVTRYEYANFYHTMTDWYNAFLLMNFFNKTQDETSILLIDAHPQGSLDSTWKVLFNRVERISELKSKTKYSNMAWNILGYSSLLLQHDTDEIPLTEEFREFFLSRFNLNLYKPLACDKLNILFVWRRNYLAHPRNPEGIISRKIRNEKDLLKAVKRRYKDHHISGIQIDLFSMQQQLKLISEADVLIGMHGAGLTHAMFLPKHAGMIELVPSYWSTMDHFLAIAKWRNLWYERWVNLDTHIEINDKTTRIPASIITTLLKTILRKMQCIKAF